MSAERDKAAMTCGCPIASNPYWQMDTLQQALARPTLVSHANSCPGYPDPETTGAPTEVEAS